MASKRARRRAVSGYEEPKSMMFENRNLEQIPDTLAKFFDIFVGYAKPSVQDELRMHMSWKHPEHLTYAKNLQTALVKKIIRARGDLLFALKKCEGKVTYSNFQKIRNAYSRYVNSALNTGLATANYYIREAVYPMKHSKSYNVKEFLERANADIERRIYEKMQIEKMVESASQDWKGLDTSVSILQKMIDMELNDETFVRLMSKKEEDLSVGEQSELTALLPEYIDVLRIHLEHLEGIGWPKSILAEMLDEKNEMIKKFKRVIKSQNAKKA